MDPSSLPFPGMCDALLTSRILNSFDYSDDSPPFDIKLFLGQIPRVYTEEQLKQVFQKIGPIRSIKILVNPQTLESKGTYARVTV